MPVAPQVDGDVVAVPGRPGHLSQLAELLAQTVELAADLVIGDLGTGDRGTQALVTGHGDLRSHLDHGLELDGPGLLAPRDLDLGRGDGVDGLILDSLDVVVGQGVTERFLACHLGTEPGFEEAPRRLAGPEAGDAGLAADLAEGGVDGLVELGLVDLDRNLDLVALKGLNAGPHRRTTLPGGPANPAYLRTTTRTPRPR